MSCSRTQHGGGRSRTPDLSLRSPTLYHWATALPILAGNEDMRKISDESEFWPDRTTDYGVSCPWASKKFPIDLQWENGVSMLARSFLIESSSKLLVTRTGIKAHSSSILGRIRPLILYLLALEWRKFTLLNFNISEASRPILIKFYV